MKYLLGLALLCAAVYIRDVDAAVTECVQCTYMTGSSSTQSSSDGCRNNKRASTTCPFSLTTVYTSCSKMISFSRSGELTISKGCDSIYHATGVTRCIDTEADGQGGHWGEGHTCYCTANGCNGATGLTAGIIVLLLPLMAKLW